MPGRTLLLVLLWVPLLLGAGPAASEELTVPLRLLRTGDIGAVPLVEVMIGAERSWWLLDTGATSNVISPHLVARIKSREIGSARVSAVGGSQQARRLALPGIALGDRTWHDVTALEVDVRSYFASTGAVVDGILGLPFMSPYAVTFDFASKELVLRASGASPDPEQQRVVPLQVEGGLPLVAVSIGDRPAERLLFDTGNPGALVLFEQRARRLRHESGSLPSITVNELGGEVTAFYVLFDRIAIDGLQARGVPAALEGGARARRGGHFDVLAGSLGVALFENNRITVDVGAQRLHLPRQAELRSPDGGFGLVLATVRNQCIVVAVIDGGPAARHGLIPGDRVTAVDGVPNTGNTATTWQSLHHKDAAEFQLERDGATRVVRLERSKFFPARR